jgi:proline racemase
VDLCSVGRRVRHLLNQVVPGTTWLVGRIDKDPGMSNELTAATGLARRFGAVTIETIDYHTAGEPFRIIPAPPVPIPGATVADRRASAITDPDVDGLRRLLCFEPRGHADMYGGMITPPDDDGAHFGVLFWHKDGFSTACGHGTIALGAWAIHSGRVATDQSGVTDVIIDVPSGRVTARVHTADDGRVISVDFVNVPSRLIATAIPVTTRRGQCVIDLVWAGTTYACLDAATVGVSVEPELVTELIALGRDVKAALANDPRVSHPTDPRLSGTYGTIIYDHLGTLPGGELHQRNVTIFADGQVDRSPCGSGTAGRVAALHATGLLADDQILVHDSIVGSRFTATIQEHTTEHGFPAVIPVVTGNAHRVATVQFEIDPYDPLVPGFVLR